MITNKIVQIATIAAEKSKDFSANDVQRNCYCVGFCEGVNWKENKEISNKTIWYKANIRPINSNAWLLVEIKNKDTNKVKYDLFTSKWNWYEYKNNFEANGVEILRWCYIKEIL